MLYWFIVIVGLMFLLFQIFFGGASVAKFKSDLPSNGTDGSAKPKKRKGVIALCLILSVVSLGMLVASLISFLS